MPPLHIRRAARFTNDKKGRNLLMRKGGARGMKKGAARGMKKGAARGDALFQIDWMPDRDPDQQPMS